MDFPLSAEAGLAGVLLVSFLAATLLPGGSEAALLGFVLLHPEQALPAWLLATLGNTAGGLSSYAIGRFLPQKVGGGDTAPRYLDAIRRHGAPLLLLAWAPLIGDALCVAAGWLRLRWLPCALWMLLGKGGRYAVLIGGLGVITARL